MSPALPASSPAYDKLITLLRELFQLDQPDLDFGLYRVLHARAAEIDKFLSQDLLPQVRRELAHYQPADKAALLKELTQAIAQAESLELNPDDSPKVKTLRQRLATEAVDVAGLEREIFDHLYLFFRRYYAEGDFLARRVYKEGTYAIPYEGEEVKLHWANRDQYYIKTSEYLRDYAFRLAFYVYPATQLPSYPATQLPSYPATQLPSYPATQLPSRARTFSASRGY